MLQRDPAAAIAAAGKPGRSEVPLLGLTASSQPTAGGVKVKGLLTDVRTRVLFKHTLQSVLVVQAKQQHLLNFARVSNNTAVMKEISSNRSIRGKNMKISYEYKPRAMLITSALRKSPLQIFYQRCQRL